jgi:anti-sigma factor RsiW
MTCEEARKSLPLFLYGELSFDEEELVEVHVDECDACRQALARERAMFAALDSVELVPSAAALAESRAELRRRLPTAGRVPETASVRSSGFWDKIREGFTIHFHFAPGIAQVAGAAAMLALGFGAGVAGAGADRFG